MQFSAKKKNNFTHKFLYVQKKNNELYYIGYGERTNWEKKSTEMSKFEIHK